MGGRQTLEDRAGGRLASAPRFHTERKVDVIVTDADQRQALVALRALGRQGCRVMAAETKSACPAFQSRWCSVSAEVPGFEVRPDRFVDAVLGLCRETGAPAILPVHDGSIAALCARRSEVERTSALALAPNAAMKVATDKTATLAVAASLGIRIPRGVLVTDPADASAAFDAVGVPAVVKPVRSWVSRGSRSRRLISEAVATRAELIAAVEARTRWGTDVLVQEWLPGSREAIMIFWARGRTWATFAQRAHRTWPPLGGNSVLRESIQPPEDIARAAELLVAEIGLEGCSEVEFRRDGNGRAALMEINPRLSASVEIALRSGVPFPSMLLALALGEPIEPVTTYKTGVTMRWLGGDLAWLQSVFRSPDRPDVPSRRAAVGTFASEFLRPMGYDYVDFRDPRPLVSATRSGIKQHGQILQHAIGRRLRGGSHDTDVAVIGAGPYGLSISAHLSAAGVRHEIFGEPMDTWRNHMPTGLCLKSEGFASSMSDPSGEHTLDQYCREHGLEWARIGRPVTLDEFAGYGEWFQRRLVPGVRRQRISRVSNGRRVFELETDDGETLRAKRVVVATGLQGHAHVPGELSAVSGDRLSHTYDDLDPQAYAGRSVIVVGAGQSALEAAVLHHEAGAHVRVVARTESLRWNSRPGGTARPWRERWRHPESGLGEGRSQWMYCHFPVPYHFASEDRRFEHGYGALGPAGAWWLRPRFEGEVEALLGRTVLQASDSDGGVELRARGPEGEETLRADHVIAGTGYRPSLQAFKFLDPQLRDRIPEARGTPVLNRWFETAVPNLFVVGYPAAGAFGPLMRFVFGTPVAARRVTRRIARRVPL